MLISFFDSTHRLDCKLKSSYTACFPEVQMRRFTLAIIVFMVAALGQIPSPAPKGKRPFTFEDMMALKRIGGPAISPDGKWVLFAAIDVDLKANKRTSHLWVVPLAGGESRQLTFDASGETGGRWSRDGKKILFVSPRGGSSQVWIADFDPTTQTLTGEARKVTSISTEADGAMWFPDGKRILFVSEVYPDCDSDSCNKARDEQRAKSQVKAMIFTRLFYRHWNHYTSFKRSHLFVASVDGGEARDITPGDHDVPPFSLGGQDNYAISPDGNEVAFHQQPRRCGGGKHEQRHLPRAREWRAREEDRQEPR
jgi:Tol biopolymer transport system component